MWINMPGMWINMLYVRCSEVKGYAGYVDKHVICKVKLKGYGVMWINVIWYGWMWKHVICKV